MLVTIYYVKMDITKKNKFYHLNIYYEDGLIGFIIGKYLYVLISRTVSQVSGTVFIIEKCN